MTDKVLFSTFISGGIRFREYAEIQKAKLACKTLTKSHIIDISKKIYPKYFITDILNAIVPSLVLQFNLEDLALIDKCSIAVESQAYF
jgi:hypothetical protein